MSQTGDGIEHAMAAAREGAWADALSSLEAVDESLLGPTELELKADCEWWLSRLEDSMATRQKAYRGYDATEDHARAAYNAWFLAYDFFSRGEGSIGAGWLERARRHLESSPACLEHAYLAIADAHAAEGRGDWAEACAASRRAVAIARSFGARDVGAVAIQTLGRELIAMGEIGEGLALVDEAMTAVLSDELGHFCTGWVYCGALVSCLELGEVGRAAEWSQAATAWCDSFSVTSPYNGLCRVYRVGVLSLRGALEEADREARRAASELASFVPALAGAAWYEIGEIHRRRGDLVTAEDAFNRAHELGMDPQPGLALIRLTQGRTDAALAALRVSLAGQTVNRLTRSRLLAAQVQVALARRDTSTAKEAATELASLRDDFGSSFLHAHADLAEGTVKLVEGEEMEALELLQRAWNRWAELRLPYEGALTRALVGEAARRGGDEERAQREALAARKALDEIGADPAVLDLVEKVLGRASLPDGLTAREVQVLTLIASGKTNREIGAELVISEHTVARHVSNVLTKLDLPSRTAATAYAIERGLTTATR